MFPNQSGGGDACVVVIFGNYRVEAGLRKLLNELQMIDRAGRYRWAAVDMRVDRALENFVDS
jgi:hypothetical protein